MLEVYKQDDPDSMLHITDFVDPITHAGGSMQFTLEVVAASSEDVLAARSHAFFEPKSDLGCGKRAGLNLRLWHSDFHVEICLCYLSLGN